jgi:diguanylate cyclase
LILVGWAFVWPHFAWQLSCRAASPHQQEIFNLKIDAIIAGLWIGVMGLYALPTAALVMMVGMNMMGSVAAACFLWG